MTKVTKNNFKLRPELRDSNVREALSLMRRSVSDLNDCFERLVRYDEQGYISGELSPIVASTLSSLLDNVRIFRNCATLLHSKHYFISDSNKLKLF